MAKLSDVDPNDATVDLRQTIKPTVRVEAAGPSQSRNASISAQSAEPPPRAEGYQLIDVLGRGGMGVVYRARQPALGRDVAIKRLQQAAAPLRDAFLAESIVTGELEHPNVVPVYALCEESGGELWLVMKRIGGRTLAELLAETPPPRPRESPPRSRETIDRGIEILLDVGDALRFAHSRGILHRDVPPENVMVGAFGEVLLLDWGVAARFGGVPDDPPGDGDAPAVSGPVPHVRGLRQIAGTPRYMAPEQAMGRGDLLGPWTDVYLLGGVLLEILTGSPPHAGDTLMEALAAACRAEPPQLGPEIPADLQAVCRTALSRDPEDRYRDVESFQGALRDYLEHRESRTLTEHADRGLEQWRAEVGRGVPPDDRARRYASVGEAIASFQHARLLWVENEPARQGESRARQEWAQLALDAGDLGVAETAIEGLGSEADSLRARIADERSERRRTLRFVRWLGGGLVALQALLVAALAWFGTWEVERFTHREIVEQLERLSRAVGAALAGVEAAHPEALDDVADALGRAEGLRIELIGPDGHQLAHSHEDQSGVSPTAAQPVVQRVLAGGEGGVMELPGALALVRPWRHEDGPTGALITALPRDVLDGPLHAVLVGGLAALVVSFLLFSLVVVRLGRRLTASLDRVL
ncbi:MAG TPA: protein kinase [Thermoanaerobaculia bacterium]|nr:protein kinase [Thermoanaerobaculia bacterium]